MTRGEFLRHATSHVVGLFAELFSGTLDRLADVYPLLIRPPGALPEGEFLQHCRRCGACVRACPHFVVRRSFRDGIWHEGTPFLALGETWCRWCAGWPCIAACPSGALARPDGVAPPPIGHARWQEGVCRRTAGEGCLACLETCPTGAISVLELHIGTTAPDAPASTVDVAGPTGSEGALAPSRLPGLAVAADRCRGCGACQSICPVRPTSAIVIDPRP